MAFSHIRCRLPLAPTAISKPHFAPSSPLRLTTSFNPSVVGIVASNEENGCHGTALLPDPLRVSSPRHGVQKRFSYGSKKFNEQNAKKEGKGSTKSSDEVPTDRRPFSLHLKSPTESITVVHIREPIAPPKEDSVGFTAGWRDVLRLARMSLLNGCAAASPTELTQQPPIPDDNAIVSVIPYASPAVDALPATS
ncbi:unnamed protein product [Dicrocoelium dendriticum]|nr:unnamed protein product [Dicrocoelium dendriticum]